MSKKMTFVKMLYIFAVGFYFAAGIYDLADGDKKSAAGDAVLMAGMGILAASTD